jgi:hypothetical protein
MIPGKGKFGILQLRDQDLNFIEEGHEAAFKPLF